MTSPLSLVVSSSSADTFLGICKDCLNSSEFRGAFRLPKKENRDDDNDDGAPPDDDGDDPVPPDFDDDDDHAE